LNKTWWANQCRSGKGRRARQPSPRRAEAWFAALEPRVLLSAVVQADETPALVSVAATTDTAVEAGSPGVFTFTRTGDTTNALTVNLAVTGEATSGVDYQALPQTITFDAGEPTAVLNVQTIDDNDVEGSERVIVQLQGGEGYVTDDATDSAIVNLSDDDSLSTTQVNIVATTTPVTEGGGNGVFTVTRTGSTAQPLTVNFDVTGEAVPGDDYTSLGNSVTFDAGEDSKTLQVQTVNDGDVEGNERVIVQLTGGQDYVVGANSSATVTLEDDDTLGTPTVNVVASDATANESGDTGVFTFTRNGSLSNPLTITYTATGTATGGTDYQTLSGSVVIPADQASATVDVTPIDDAQQEGNETVIVQIADGGANYAIGDDGSATVTLTDDEQAPVPQVNIVANDPDALESGNTGTYTVTRTGSTDGDLTVNFTIAGSATNGVDYQNIPASVTIASGESTATLTIAPIDDALVEGSETVLITLNPSDDYSIGSDDDATVTIADDDQSQVVTLNVTDAQATEGGGSGAITVSRTGSVQDDLVVQLSVSGSAANGVDYDTIPATVTIPGGSTSVTISVTPINDAAVEGDETVTLTLQPNEAYSLGDTTQGTVTIVDNELEEPQVTILATDANASEDGNTGTFTVFRTGSTDGELVVNYSVTGSATGGADYNAIQNSVTIPAGSSSANITITPISDDTAEGSEQVTLTLMDDQAYNLGDADTATVTITDDPALPEVSLSATDATAFEPGGTGTFTITRVGSTEQDLTVQVQIAGTAANGVDYDNLNTTVTIPAGSSTATVTVNPIDDGDVEGDETVILSLVDDAGYNLAGQSSDTVTIADGDVPTIVSIVASDDTATEGDGNAVFTVTRTGSTAQDLTVEFTVTGAATNGADYQTITTTVTIPAGESTVDVTVVPINDAEVEGDETVILTLNPSGNYTLAQQAQATATIQDDDSLPVVTIAATDSSASEGGDAGSLVITRTGSTDQPLTVQFNITGAATNGVDYQTLQNTVTIAAGESTAQITVTPIDDDTFEGNETVIVTLTDTEGYSVGGQNTATVTIQDNDTQAPTISVTASDDVATEAGDGGTFLITRSDTDGDLTVNYVLTGSATNGTDYQTLSGSVVIPNGQNSVQIDLTPIQDATVEGQELATLTLIDAASYQIGIASDTISIVDDDGQLGDLALTADDGALPDTIVPGQKLKRTFLVTNVGAQDIRGEATLRVYLLPLGQDLPGAGDEPVFSRERTFNVKQGRTKKVKANFTVPDNVDVGNARLVAVLDQENQIPESNVLNNVVRSEPTEIAFAFGDVDGQNIKKLTVNGVTYSLRGQGQGTVIQGVGDQPDSVQLSGTDAATRLSLRGDRNGASRVQNINVQGDLADIRNQNVAVAGNVNTTGTLGGITNANFVGDNQQTIDIQGDTQGRVFNLRGGNIRNVSINSGIPVGRLQVVDWMDTDGNVDLINAPSIDRLQSRGDFTADLNLTDTQTSLNRAQIRGALANSDIRTAGSINDISAGVFQGSNVYSGVINGFNGLPTGPNDFAGNARIGNLTATGIRGDTRASFSNSRIAADQLGNVTLRDVDTNNTGQEFGIAANTSVDRFSLGGQQPQSGLTNTGNFSSDGDFNARIV
jgi:hypothetical protein